MYERVDLRNSENQLLTQSPQSSHPADLPSYYKPQHRYTDSVFLELARTGHSAFDQLMPADKSKDVPLHHNT
jgi:hypothetical protein